MLQQPKFSTILRRHRCKRRRRLLLKTHPSSRSSNHSSCKEDSSARFKCALTAPSHEDTNAIEIIRMKAQQLLEKSCLYLNILMVVVMMYSLFSEDIQSCSVHVRFTIPMVVILAGQGIKILTKKWPQFMQYAPIVIMWVSIITALERQISMSPHHFEMPQR